MRYCLSVNRQQKQQLQELEEFHNKVIKENKDNFKELVIEFVNKHRENKTILKKPYIYSILDCINRIIFSFKEFKDAKSKPIHIKDEKGDYPQTKEEVMTLIFFVNAKAFLDLLQKHTKIKIDNNLFKDIKKMRDYLVHFYEKEIEQRRFFVDLSIERGLRDLSVLEVRDIDTRELENEVYFSLDLFYFALKDISEKLMRDLHLLK